MAATPDTHATPDQDRRDWLAWREHRGKALREPNGWLSLTSLTWLDAAPQSVPGFPGLWSARGSAVPSAGGEDWKAEVLLPADSAVTRDGAPATGTVTISLGAGDSDSSLACGDVVAEVAQRGDGVIVRIRDPRAATRAGFRGVPVFDFDPAWIRPARLALDPEPHGTTVPSAQPGLRTRLTALGRVEVVLPDGSTADLLVTGSPDSPSVIFHDPTNGVETSAWRAAPIVLSTGGRAPVDEGGADATAGTADRVEPVEGGTGDALVDFNRSTNFPAHFTAYGTCPTPPEGNDLPVAVTAGEKAPAPPDQPAPPEQPAAPEQPAPPAQA